MKKQMLKGLTLGLFVATTFSPLHAQTPAETPAPQVEPVQESAGEEMGYGLGAALASLFYIPAKFTYASLGLLTGGLGYVVTGGRTDVANSIIYPSVKGNWVVTPSNLRGTEPLYFVGPPPPEPGPRVEAAPPTATR
jgi:hypothetical protein